MPETRLVLISEIDPPDTPVRTRMDDAALAELCDSLKADGQIHAICLVQRGPRYEIKVGHRRFVAASMLNWLEIRADIYQPSDWNGDAAMIAENRCREKVNPVDEALLFAEHQMRDELDEAGLCARFHVTPGYLGDRLCLLRGDEQVRDALHENRINFSVARELNKCDDEQHRRYLLDIAITSGYSARVIQDFVRQWRQNTAPAAAVVVPPSGHEEPPPAADYRVRCALCGGDLDPWNLIPIMIHKREWDEIQRIMREAADPKECLSNESLTERERPSA